MVSLEGDSFTVSFEGTGFALSGETRENAILGVSIDGETSQAFSSRMVSFRLLPA